MVETAVAATIQ